MSLLTFCLGLTSIWLIWRGTSSAIDPLTILTTIVWTVPVLVVVQGLVGLFVTLRRTCPAPPREVPTSVDNLLIVVIPSVARKDTLAGLTRVVRSCCEHLATAFPQLRVDVVVDEGCAGADDVAKLASTDRRIRVITVPDGYRTPKGTRFKARANQYAHELRGRDGEARDDVWVLHMDDDTGVGADTAEALARFVSARRRVGTDSVHLTQGVLTYPRELAANRYTWFADALRSACDVTIFAASTGLGSPRNGLHGELLCVRASVEAEIGWDFGPTSIVEDAEFALRFCERFPGGSEWLPGRAYGASPATVGAFVRQRERWVRGMLELAGRRVVPLRQRILMLHNVCVWLFAPIAHPLTVLVLAVLLRDADTLPATAALLPVWTLNMAFWLYLYWEGLRLNALSSASPRRRLSELLAVVVLMPVFAALESAGVVRGVFAALRGGDLSFTVIPKPR
jgi:beta-1,4-mannosyltransferase